MELITNETLKTYHENYRDLFFNELSKLTDFINQNNETSFMNFSKYDSPQKVVDKTINIINFINNKHKSNIDENITIYSSNSKIIDIINNIVILEKGRKDNNG
jgi:hypothetical protein